MDEYLSKEKGKKIISLANEAFCRGALESGVDFVSTFPGTPASEIGNFFWQKKEEIKKINPNFHFEFSTNEKVATEAAAGAAFSGAHSLVAFKNFGLNVASDFLMTLMYTPLKGAMVIFIADDPSCWSSAQAEEDTRLFLKMAHIPILEPSTVQEFKDFAKIAFEISEKFKIPVAVRSTTRTSHQAGVLQLGELKEKEKTKFSFEKKPSQFSTMPPRVLEMKKELLRKIEKIRQLAEKNKLNKVFYQNSKEKTGIITSGISFSYVQEISEKMNVNLPILKIETPYPLPEEKIGKFLKKLKQVLVVEEIDPYLEEEITVLAKKYNCRVKIFGKKEGPIEGGRMWKERKAILPMVGELKPEYVEIALTKILKKKTTFEYQKHLQKLEEIKIPPRPPIICPNCPYWGVIKAIKKVVNLEEVVFGGEIGCYMLLSHKVINLQDYLYCMGSNNGVAHGISKTTGQKIITFIGDSSFFHAGIPALLNVVVNKSNPLIIILDNQTTAMTGHQPHPGTAGVKIEEVVKACGVKNLKIVDQLTNPEELEETIKEFLTKDEVAVIIARHICALLEQKQKQ